MKIAVLCGHYPYSGAGVIAFESAQELAHRHDVTFIHGGEEDRVSDERGLRVVSVKLPPEPGRQGWHLYWNPGVIRRLRALLRDMNPDLVHFHIVQRRSFSLASLLLSRRHRSVWTLHDQWHLCVRSVPEPPSCEGMRRFCLFCTAWPGLSVMNKLVKEAVYAASPLEVVVPSRWLAELTGYSLLGRKKVHLVYNGVDLARFHPSVDEEAGSRPGEITLLFVAGPNDPTKGLADLLQAFSLLRPKHPSLRLKIVGDPPPGTGDLPGVEVAGKVSRDRMPAEYRRCHLFVLPTLADNTPVTVMEAMASGLPVVATRVGGIPELVEEGATGRLVPRGDVRSLANALEGLVQDATARRRMGRAARAESERRFSKHRMVADLERVYEGMLGGPMKVAVEAAAVTAAGGPR